MKMLLFDVDGTLIRSGSGLSLVHNMAFVEGLRKVYGANITAMDLKGYGGRTDRFIASDVLRKKGFDEHAISQGLDALFDEMVKDFAQNVVKKDYKDCLLDGVESTLEELSKNDDYLIGLLTGNVTDIASMKMKAIGLAKYFKIGGFGNMSEKRSDLIDVAIADGRKKGLLLDIDMKRIYIIGDTRHDINCAKEKGAVSVAISTGNETKEVLATFKPDYLIEKMPELVKIVAWD